jgi:Sulfotransferase family
VAQALTYVFCLGATKAGTSWLQDQLAAHPDCRMRTIKEYHYFTKTKPADFDAAIAANAREMARLTAKNAARAFDQGAWARQNIADLQAYDAVLARGLPDAAAFAALLQGGAGQGHVMGDFTPAYALMSEPKLKDLAAFAPDTRAIYLIRDPVARLWSHIRMVAASAAWALLDRIMHGDRTGECGAITQRGDYAAVLPKLKRAFDPSRLLVMFYEDMLTQPGFARICAFLGIAARPADLNRKVHAGKPLTLTAADRLAAARFLRPQYEFVAQMFPALPAAWALAMNEA